MLTRISARSIGAIAWALAACGCAVVDPKKDFDQTSEHVSAAIGMDAGSLPARQQERSRIPESLPPAGLTADDAVRVCLLNNPRIIQALLSIGIARADVVQSGLFHNPSLSLSVRLPDGGGLADIDVGVAQNIADLWLIPVQRRAAEAELQRRILEVARDVSVVALETRTEYFRALGADRERAIAEENRAIARQLLDAAEARQQAGAGNQIDVNLARAGVLDAELALRNTGLAAYQARRGLATVMGVEWHPGDIRLLEALPAPPGWTLSDERLVELAKASRLDLLAARLNVDAAAARVVQERRSVFGDVEVGVDMERDARRKGDDDGQDVVVGPTLSLALPIFHQNQAQIAKAEFTYEQAVIAHSALELDIVQTSRAAHAQARTAWEVFGLFRDELVPLLQENLELSREAYRAGKVSFLAVLETHQALLKNRAKFVEAQRNSAEAVVELEKAVGRPMADIVANEMQRQTTAQPSETR